MSHTCILNGIETHLRVLSTLAAAELGWMSMGFVDTIMAGRLGAAAIGARGWLESVGEREAGVASVSAPVCDRGAVVAAVPPLATISNHYLLSAHLLTNVAIAEWAPALLVLGIPFLFDPGQGMPMFSGAELDEFIRLADYVAVNDYEGTRVMQKSLVAGDRPYGPR